MIGQAVVYVDKKADNTGKFTERMQQLLEKIAEQGIEVVAAVPNTGLNETLGIWLFVKRHADGA